MSLANNRLRACLYLIKLLINLKSSVSMNPITRMTAALTVSPQKW